MFCYSITYDLLKQGQNYDGLIQRLKGLGGVSVELSEWVLWNNARAIDIANDLLRFMDGNDRLFVKEITSNCAWYNLRVTNDTAKKILPAA